MLKRVIYNRVTQELVENALDANATSIDVRFRELGVESFEVSGEELSLTRHYISLKSRLLKRLSIQTMVREFHRPTSRL